MHVPSTLKDGGGIGEEITAVDDVNVDDEDDEKDVNDGGALDGVGSQTHGGFGQGVSGRDVKVDEIVMMKNKRKGKKFRICIITFEFSPLTQSGGIGTAYRELADTLAAGGHNVTVAIPNHNVAFAIDAKTGRWKRHIQRDLDKVKFNVRAIDSSRFSVEPSYFASSSFHMAEWLAEQEKDFDFVHAAENQGMAFASSQLKHLGLAFPKTEFISTLHGASSWAMLLSGSFPTRLDQLEEFLYEKHQIARSLVVSPSNYMIDYLKKRGQEFKRMPFVIPNIMSVDDPRGSSASSKTSDFRLEELVFFGRLESRKGLVMFIKALNSLADNNFPFDKVAVTFLGRSMTLGDGLTTSEALIRETHAKSGWKTAKLNVLTTLQRNEALQYITSKNRLVVMPSLNDNSPYAVAECLALGVNFIASKVGGIPELIHTDDIDRATFSPPTYYALAHKITNIQENPDNFRQARAKWAHDTIRSKWLHLHNVVDREAVHSSDAVTLPQLHISGAGRISSEYSADQSHSIVIVAPSGLPDGAIQATLLSIKIQVDVKVQDILIVSPVLEKCDDAANLCMIFKSMPSSVKISFSKGILSSAVDLVDGNRFVFIRGGELFAGSNSLSQMSAAMESTKADMIIPYVEDYKPNSNDLRSLVSERASLTHLSERVEKMTSDRATSPKVYAYVGPDSALGLLDSSRLSHGFLYIHRALRDVFSSTWALEEYSLQQFAVQLCMRMANVDGQKRVEILPRALVRGQIAHFKPAQPADNSDSLNEFMSEMQGMAPYLDRVGDDRLVDYILYQHGVADHAKRNSEDSNLVTDSVDDFGNQQGSKGWFYGLKTNLTGDLIYNSRSTGASGANIFYFRDGWYLADLPKKHPVFTSRMLHPISSTDLRYIATKRYLSSASFSAVVRIDLEYWGTCGDGVIFTAQLDGKVIAEQNLTTPDRQTVEVKADFWQGSTLDLNVDPNGNDWCDATIAHATILRSGEDNPSRAPEKSLTQALLDHSSSIAVFPPVEPVGESDATTKDALTYGFAHALATEHTLGSCITSRPGHKKSEFLAKQDGAFIKKNGVHPSADSNNHTTISPCFSLALENEARLRLHLVADVSGGGESTADGVAVLVREMYMDDDNNHQAETLLRHYIPAGESLRIASDTLHLRKGAQLDIILFPMANAHWDYTSLSFRLVKESIDGKDPLPVPYGHPDHSITHLDELSVSAASEDLERWMTRVDSAPTVQLGASNRTENNELLGAVVKTLRIIDHPSPYCVLHGFERQAEGLHFADFLISDAKDVDEMIHKIENATDPLLVERTRTISFAFSKDRYLRRKTLRAFFEVGAPFLLKSKKVKNFALFSIDRAQTGGSFLNGWYSFEKGPGKAADLRAAFKKLLEEPKFIKYYATQHYSSMEGYDHYDKSLDDGGIYKHDKVHPVAVGASQCEPLSKALRQVDTGASKYAVPRRKTLYVNTALHSGRGEAYEKLKKVLKMPLKNRYGLSMDEYIQDLQEHKMVWSPPGGGVDCYRHYEAMMMGSVPVVEEHPLAERLLANMPVIWYKNIEDLTAKYLEQQYSRVKSQKHDLRPLFSWYWRVRIADHLYTTN